MDDKCEETDCSIDSELNIDTELCYHRASYHPESIKSSRKVLGACRGGIDRVKIADGVLLGINKAICPRTASQSRLGLCSHLPPWTHSWMFYVTRASHQWGHQCPTYNVMLLSRLHIHALKRGHGNHDTSQWLSRNWVCGTDIEESACKPPSQLNDKHISESEVVAPHPPMRKTSGSFRLHLEDRKHMTEAKFVMVECFKPRSKTANCGYQGQMR